MKFTLHEFYSDNYKDFVHIEALRKILREVPELKLADIDDVDNMLSIEFSVDEWGENPMYITYLDKEGNKHIVKIRPAVSSQISDVLKEYAKISYVDEQDNKLRDELTESILTSANQYTDNIKNDLLTVIDNTKNDLKEYCDNKCELTLISAKNYIDAKADEIHQEIDEKHDYNAQTYMKGFITDGGQVQYDKSLNRIYVDPDTTKYLHYLGFSKRNEDGTSEINYGQGYYLNGEGLKKFNELATKPDLPITLTVPDKTATFVSNLGFELTKYNNQDFVWAHISDGIDDVRAILINEENMQKLYDLDLSSYASKADVENLSNQVNKNSDKLSNFVDGDKVSSIYWYTEKYTPNYIRLLPINGYIREHIDYGNGQEKIGYLPTFPTTSIKWRDLGDTPVRWINLTTVTDDHIQLDINGDAPAVIQSPVYWLKKLPTNVKQDMESVVADVSNMTFDVGNNSLSVTDNRGTNEYQFSDANTLNNMQQQINNNITNIAYLMENISKVTTENFSPDEIIAQTGFGNDATEAFMNTTKNTNISVTATRLKRDDILLMGIVNFYGTITASTGFKRSGDWLAVNISELGWFFRSLNTQTTNKSLVLSYIDSSGKNCPFTEYQVKWGGNDNILLYCKLKDRYDETIAVTSCDISGILIILGGKYYEQN